MRVRSRGRFLWLSCWLLPLVLAGPVVVSSAAAQSGGATEIVASGLLRQDAARVEAYWTEERMSRARPAPLHRMRRVDRPASLSVAFDAPPGPEGRVPGSYPLEEPGPWLEAHAADVPEPSPGGALVLKARAYRYPFPYTRYSIFTRYKDYPYRTIGKLFFSHAGSDYVCSGAVGTRRAIWTAGHCVATEGSWHTDVLFVPAYQNGRRPYGAWSAEQMFTTATWLQQEHNSHDIAMIVLQDSGGRSIGDRTGWLGALWNTSRLQHWSILGYPAAAPFNGRLLWVCHASWAEDDRAGSAPKTVGAGCDLTGGSSGGPWIARLSGDAGDTNYVNGVMSYGYDVAREASYSPYFGDSARDLYNRVVNE